MILKVVVIILIIVIIGIFFIARTKGVSPLSWNLHKPINQSKQLAINGFDPVSYFEFGKAEQGKSTFAYKWKDVQWQFSSSEHLEKFKANPQQFEPQFGGYCSFAVSKGFTATPDPEAWHIQQGKLYFFADEAMKKNWLSQLPNILATCEKKWQN